MTSSTPRWSGAVLAILTLAACDQTPAEPMLEVDPQSNAAAIAAVEGFSSLLTSGEEVQLMALEALAAQPSNADADPLILEAGDLEAEALAAEQAAETTIAETLSAWAGDAYVEAALVVLGPSFAAQTVGNVQAAVGHVEAALAEGVPSTSVRGPLDRARSLADRASVELSRGNDAGALRDGVAAADALRDVSPKNRAKHFVAMAQRLLAKAKELVGPDTRPEILQIVRDASAHCDAAVRALYSENWQLAVREARRCAALSRRVIALLSGGIPDDRLQEHAMAIVEHAADLYHRAVGLAGDDPAPKVRRALDEAAELLRNAEHALAEKQWRRAIALARSSAAISKRVIGFLTDDRPSDGLQARAEHAVQHAKDLLHRAVTMAGDDPRPEIAAHLAHARELIGEANAALSEENWRRAIAKAHEAARIIYRVILLLS